MTSSPASNSRPKTAAFIDCLLNTSPVNKDELARNALQDKHRAESVLYLNVIHNPIELRNQAASKLAAIVGIFRLHRPRFTACFSVTLMSNLVSSLYVVSQSTPYVVGRCSWARPNISDIVEDCWIPD